MAKGVLVDLTKCIGCGSCTVACKMYNNNQWIEDRAPTSGEEATLADENWTVIQKCRFKKEPEPHANVRTNGVTTPTETDSNEMWRFVKRQCMHCKEPACASSCFATAFRKNESGETVYYPNLCVGCRYCMLACPFSIPKFEWSKAIPMLTKCMMCSSRIAKGDAPACVVVCPTKVMKFGEQEELLKEARATIADDNRYVRHIYGEEEAGGTAWIYISDKPFEELGFKMNVPKRSIPSYTRNYMHSTPIFGAVWAVVLACLYFFTRRRSTVQDSAAKESAGKKGE